MRRRKIVIITAAILTLAAVITFTVRLIYNQNADSYYIIYIPKEVNGSDFWKSVIAGAEMAAKENEVKLEIMGPREEKEIELQNEMIEAAIKKKPDAIVVSPNSYEESQASLRKVKEAGIKLVYIDSDTSEKIEDAIVATDNFEAGRKMGEYANNCLDQDSVIAIVAHVKNSSTAMEREQGFRAAIGDYEKQIVEVAYSNSDYDQAYEETKKLVEEYDIDVLACLNEYSAVGAARAIKDMGFGGKITVLGFDNSMEEIELLEEGVFSAIVVQRAFSMGYLGIETTVECIRDDSEGISLDSGSLLITKDTMYDVENQEVLFPFYGD